MTLYMKTTKDKYELPLVVEDSVQMLAQKLGLTPGTVASSISKKRPGYYRIVIEDDLSDAEET